MAAHASSSNSHRPTQTPRAVTGSTDTANSTARRQTRVSCDNCRTKKLRCSGDRPICSRCSSASRECSYSSRLQMGRPKTRRVSRQQISSSKAPVPVTLSPSVYSSLTENATSHDQGTALRTPIGGESSLQGPITRPFDITSEITSETPFLDDSYHLYGSAHTSSNPELEDPAYPVPAFIPGVPSPSQADKCACSSVLYLLLEQLRNKTQWVIPDDLMILRNCKEKALAVVGCDQCPLRYFSVIQNGLILGVVTTCIAERYARLLEQIDEEELQATGKGEKKLLDISSIKSNLGRESTSARPSFTVEVPPSEWRELMRRIIKSEIHGLQGQRENCFMSFVLQLEERQKSWHRIPPAHDCPSHYRSSCDHPDRVPSCLIVIDDTKRLINNLHL